MALQEAVLCGLSMVMLAFWPIRIQGFHIVFHPNRLRKRLPNICISVHFLDKQQLFRERLLIKGVVDVGCDD